MKQNKWQSIHIEDKLLRLAEEAVRRRLQASVNKQLHDAGCEVTDAEVRGLVEKQMKNPETQELIRDTATRYARDKISARLPKAGARQHDPLEQKDKENTLLPQKSFK